MFGISDHLEIAMNKANASGLLGLNLGDSVTIEFNNIPL
jgi:S-adenosylmethionine hydrolase